MKQIDDRWQGEKGIYLQVYTRITFALIDWMFVISHNPTIGDFCTTLVGIWSRQDTIPTRRSFAQEKLRVHLIEEAISAEKQSEDIIFEWNQHRAAPGMFA